MIGSLPWLWLLLASGAARAAEATSSPPGPAPGPVLLDDRFELPPGFHIYRAAEPELTGGSYDLVFDGDGRLLVGDGHAVRRLIDVNGDGVYDRFEVIATGLGGRGPQGLLVWGDRLYAVGGDGLQVFDGYRADRLVHRGRLGAKFRTGGDHDLHTVLRGYDGWLYLMAGNGAGIAGRTHITEAGSPMVAEREASVFRLDPDGRQWECLAAGGRNPPGLGLNHLGELFSFDSDMEWHVGLPWYRPVQLNHWAMGTDQGWQEVGAYPGYYIDCVPPVVQAGRGSPTWGVFYEHRQLPARYRHALLNCDYRWKGESNNQYTTSGRLVAFFLERDGAEWQARVETLVRPKSGARDGRGRPIDFALVDIDVAPDGSLFVSDHNQGVWRIFHDERRNPPAPPRVQPGRAPVPQGLPLIVAEMLGMPQPLSEWSRVREELLGAAGGTALTNVLLSVAARAGEPLADRVRAIQLLAPAWAGLDARWLRQLAADVEPEIRGQAAWLLGLRTNASDASGLLALLMDPEALVRRRAAESLTRISSPTVVTGLVERLDDGSRLTQFIAMNALAHHPTEQWLDLAMQSAKPSVRMRALVASVQRGEAPPPERVRAILKPIFQPPGAPVSGPDRLDFLRTLVLFEKVLATNADSRASVERYLLSVFPASAVPIRWEQARVLGIYRFERSFGPLLRWLRTERDQVTQFHLAQALARLPGGWSAEEESAAVQWFEGTQRGWFADFSDKGVEFPQSWATVLAEFARHHPAALAARASAIDVTSLLGGAVIDVLVAQDPSGAEVMKLYRAQSQVTARARVAEAFSRVRSAQLGSEIRGELLGHPGAAVRTALLRALAAQPPDAASVRFLIAGLVDAEPELARALVKALTVLRPAMDRELAGTCLERLSSGPRLVHPVERLLVTLTGQQRPGYQADTDLTRHADEPERDAAIQFWKAWFATRFGEPFVARAVPAIRERSDAEVGRFLVGEFARGGDARRGAAVYERLQCQTCHGAGATPGRSGPIYGPDLTGVTRRLSRAELADALVYPSRQVADRFKAVELEKKDGTVLTGFVTEASDDAVTVATAQGLQRVVPADIARQALGATSLMPERLLNALTDGELRDLLAYLENFGLPPAGN